ncbi:MAG: nucleotidyltransferase domain-containing protein [Candidatus Levybacteria bacterium]|nr:nucleotidyltransferase domain-containing protein [Candidatus Levybacteria bacterium]
MDPTPLETHRFQITPDSMASMKGLRDSLGEIQRDLPQVKGLGFFGSRTKGLERSDSDLDIAVFYDGSEFGTLRPTDGQEILRRSLVIDREKGTVKVGNSDEAVKPIKERQTLEERMRQSIEERTGVKIGFTPVDISQAATDRLLSEFRKEAWDPSQASATVYPDEHIKLLARFFLSAGKQIYKNREYIFDELRRNPNGEELFKLLMKRLAAFERTRNVLRGNPRKGRVEFKGYPKTIEEGEKYFLMKSLDV